MAARFKLWALSYMLWATRLSLFLPSNNYFNLKPTFQTQIQIQKTNSKNKFNNGFSLTHMYQKSSRGGTTK